MSGESSNQPSALAVEQEKRERAQAKRLENAAKLAEERIHARQRRLKAIQKHDREIDKLLLFGGMDESPFQEKPESGPWFTSIDMSGEENYILHYMATYVKNQWSKERLKSIEKLLTNMDFITKPFAGHLGDTEDFHNTEGYERTTILRDIGVAVGELHDREQTPLFIADRVWNHIKAAFSLLDHLCLLRRLTDGNNPETVQRPLPDGTNLEFPALRSSWVLHRAWIRALHYRSLHAGAQDYGVKHIRQVLALSMVLLDGEVARRSSGDADYPIEFHSFSQCSYSLITALNGVLSDLLTDPRPAQEGVEYTPEETLLFNIESDRMVSIYKTNFDPINKIWQLWAYLLHLNDEFNRRMDYEHVEDTLISKRVVVNDEFWELSNVLAGGHEPLNWSTLYSSDFEDDICLILRKISQVNRHRRDFLLLRDWSHRRPWKQLYYVFDTSDGEQDFFIGPIYEFYSEINNLAEYERTDPECKYKHPSPSSRANIWAQLFPIHPVASTEPEKSPLRTCNYDGGCIICLESFEPGFIIARLHCSHLYHYTCIRTMWDQPGVHTFTCPICRTDSVKWSLHEQAGITPEVADVWDNELSIGDQALEHPNITEDNDLYWMWENERLATSAQWNEQHGDEPRDVMVEMAHVRKARRMRNERLRERVSLRDKIEGLDPTAYGQA